MRGFTGRGEGPPGSAGSRPAPLVATRRRLSRTVSAGGDHDIQGQLIRGVNIALGGAPVSECPPFDRVVDGRVTVDELVRGVRNALR